MCLYRIKRKAAFIGTICLDALLSHLWFSWFLDKEKAPTELAEERQIINDLTNVIKQRIALGTQLEDDKHRYCFFGCTAYPMQKKGLNTQFTRCLLYAIPDNKNYHFRKYIYLSHSEWNKNRHSLWSFFFFKLVKLCA